MTESEIIMSKKNNNTTANATIDALTKKALDANQKADTATKTDDKPKVDDKPAAPKADDKPKANDKKADDKPKAKTYKDAAVNKDKVEKKVATALDADKKAIKAALDKYIKDDKTITVNIDYKKAKITVKRANKLIARLNKRKNDFYLRTYKDSKETIAKNQTLDACTKAIEKLLK